MRSLFSGVSGLKVHQTKMDVIGNNISNVNTVGFKSSSVNFTDIFYQTTQSATGPNATTGSAGKNAMQIGLGSNLASITTNISVSGGAQRTDNPFDVMINGDAFFIVKSGGANYFTKSGAFTVDAAGTLATGSGATVMGWQAVNGEIQKDAVSELKIMSPENLYAEPEATESTYVQGNIDQKDKQVAFGSDGFPVQVSFFDNLGNSYIAKLGVTQTEAASNKYSVTLKDIVSNDESLFVKKTTTGGVTTYSEGKLTEVSFGGQTYKMTKGADFATTGEYTITTADTDINMLEFSGTNGSFVAVTPDATVPTDSVNTTGVGNSLNLGFTGLVPNPFSATGIDIDFSKITMYSTSGSSSIESTKGDLEGNGAGKQVGNMTGISIDTAGKIFGSYDNGDEVLLGQIAVATFSNPSGLESVGNSMFAQTQNSGEFDGIGQDPTQDGGSLSTGVLEMSNVDLSSEFTNMITTQRGFQANSRIITTSDTMLEELINLKR